MIQIGSKLPSGYLVSMVLCDIVGQVLSVGGVGGPVSDTNTFWIKQEIEKTLLKYFELRVSNLVPGPRAPPGKKQSGESKQ